MCYAPYAISIFLIVLHWKRSFLYNYQYQTNDMLFFLQEKSPQGYFFSNYKVHLRDR